MRMRNWYVGGAETCRLPRPREHETLYNLPARDSGGMARLLLRAGARAPRALPRLREPRASSGTRRRWVATTAVMATQDRERFVLDLGSINPNLKEVQYAVRGPVLDRAMAIDRDLAKVTL